MIRRMSIIGALAALWIAPAAAQVGSTSTGNEHSYPSGNGTDVTRSNTDPSTAPSSSRSGEHEVLAPNGKVQTNITNPAAPSSPAPEHEALSPNGRLHTNDGMANRRNPPQSSSSSENPLNQGSSAPSQSGTGSSGSGSSNR